MVFLIRKEKANHISFLTDVKEMHSATNEVLDGIRKDLDQEKKPRMRSLLVDDFIQYQDQLDDFADLLKVPFDVLVVVEKDGGGDLRD